MSSFSLSASKLLQKKCPQHKFCGLKNAAVHLCSLHQSKNTSYISEPQRAWNGFNPVEHNRLETQVCKQWACSVSPLWLAHRSVRSLPKATWQEEMGETFVQTTQNMLTHLNNAQICFPRFSWSPDPGTGLYISLLAVAAYRYWHNVIGHNWSNYFQQPVFPQPELNYHLPRDISVQGWAPIQPGPCVAEWKGFTMQHFHLLSQDQWPVGDWKTYLVSKKTLPTHFCHFSCGQQSATPRTRDYLTMRSYLHTKSLLQSCIETFKMNLLWIINWPFPQKLNLTCWKFFKASTFLF